jgi:hypothetical protein
VRLADGHDRMLQNDCAQSVLFGSWAVVLAHFCSTLNLTDFDTAPLPRRRTKDARPRAATTRGCTYARSAPIDTDMSRGLGPDAVDATINDSPMKRLGAAEEVAHTVARLCSDASNFNMGTVFEMSGGRARY